MKNKMKLRKPYNKIGVRGNLKEKDKKYLLSLKKRNWNLKYKSKTLQIKKQKKSTN
jgi:hypothetical protein